MINVIKKTADEFFFLKEDILSTLSYFSTIEKIASKSYVHPNGFTKIVYDVHEDSICRLHIYPSGAVADKNIHDHRWDFSSTTICGSLPMSIYEIESGSTHILHEYRKGVQTGHSISRVGVCTATRSKLIWIPTQHGYYMPSDIFHRIEAVRELTITYVETYPAQSETCYLINEEDRSTDSNSDEYVPQPLSVAQTIEALLMIVNKIEEME